MEGFCLSFTYIRATAIIDRFVDALHICNGYQLGRRTTISDVTALSHTENKTWPTYEMRPSFRVSLAEP